MQDFWKKLCSVLMGQKFFLKLETEFELEKVKKLFSYEKKIINGLKPLM